MSFDKFLGKEHRKPYYRNGRFDPTCRPGGDCPYCRENRAHSTAKRELSAQEKLDFHWQAAERFKRLFRCVPLNDIEKL